MHVHYIVDTIIMSQSYMGDRHDIDDMRIVFNKHFFDQFYIQCMHNVCFFSCHFPDPL